MAFVVERTAGKKGGTDRLNPEMDLASGYLSQSNLKRAIEQLSAYPTRNTNTAECDQALERIEEWLSQVPALEVERFEYTLSQGPRVPVEKVSSCIVATLHGDDRAIIMVGAHLDSLNRNGNPFVDAAPGANDDASGVALVLECARLMSQRNWAHTLKFVIFTGEEQGLLGSSALAEFAQTKEWPIVALLNLDTVGSSRNGQGIVASDRVRVFSEEATEHQSRELARFIEWLNATRPAEEAVCFDPIHKRERQEEVEFRPELILRQDRLGRGGDHIPFNRHGYTAVRFVESAEDLARQHTPDDLIKHIDFSYLTNVGRVVLHTLTALSNAEPDPIQVRIVRELGIDTVIEWDGNPDQDFEVFIRPTDAAQWQKVERVKGLKHTFKALSKDDFFYAVGSIGGIPVPAQ